MTPELRNKFLGAHLYQIKDESANYLLDFLSELAAFLDNSFAYIIVNYRIIWITDFMTKRLFKENLRISQRAKEISPFYVMGLLARARDLEKQGKDIIHMEVGEPDFPTPTPIVTAGIELLKTGNIHYTPAAGLLALRKKIAGYYWERYSVRISPSRVFVTPGASGALLLVLAALLDEGDEVLLPDPGYPCNRNIIRLLNSQSKQIAVGKQDDYQLNARLVNENWAKNSRGVLISSPSNPTGSLIEGDNFRELIEAVHAKGGFLVSDEIYHGLTYEKQADSALQYSDNLFVVNSFSKYFGMTGWRVGWAIVPEHFIETIERLSQNIFIAAGTHSQQAALAAFDSETILELERRKKIFMDRRNFLCSALVDLGFSIPVQPEGAFYIYAGCDELTKDSFTFCRKLLEKEGVAVTPGCDFGDNESGQHVRFAYTTNSERLTCGIERIGRLLKGQTL